MNRFWRPRLITPLITLFIAVLSGCSGFHLRAPLALSPVLQRPYLQTASPYSPLTHQLLATLRLSGVTPVESRSDASVILAILTDQRSQTLLSVSSTQSTRQYRLSLLVTFQITDQKGTVLVSPQTVSESRTLTMASDQILSSSNEVNTLYHQIRAAAVHDVINRLASHEISDILAGSKHRPRK